VAIAVLQEVVGIVAAAAVEDDKHTSKLIVLIRSSGILHAMK